MDKIKMTTPLVEMDGDEMTRILWKMIKDELLYPFIDLKTEYYDLGLEHRNETDEKVRGCCKMCDDYAECRPYDGVSSQGDVEEPERNDPRHAGRNGVPCTDYRQGDRAVREELEKADHDRETCIRRRL